MTLHSQCADMREQLEAFHDGELNIDERIAIQQHLAECASCSHVSVELASLGETLRALAVAVDSETEPSNFAAHVIERLRVEESFSIRAQLVDWFQDMHLVWAGLGASVATLICVV